MSNVTTLIIVLTILHFGVLGVWAAIRFWPTEATGATGESAKSTPCAVCGAHATHREYDGLDPNEQRNPRTGRSWSYDTAHYRPLCGAH